MKKIISLLLVLVVALSLFSCDNNSNNNSNSSSDNNGSYENEQSAYDKLNELEKLVVDALIETSDAFFNPSEVRILKVDSAMKTDNGMVYTRLQLQGTNKLGGTLTKWYCILESPSKPGTYTTLETFSSSGVCDDVSVGKMNKAITEYWEEQGV